MVCLVSPACIYQPTPEQQAKIDKILEASRKTLGDQRFVSTLRSATTADFDHDSDLDSAKTHGGSDVLAGLQAHLPTQVRCRWPKNPFNRKTKAWDGGGVPQLRCDLFDERTYADWVGTVLHETAHTAGYLHDGQRRDGNQCTVPHVIGDLATLVASGQSSGSLPSDVCKHLPATIERAGMAAGAVSPRPLDPAADDEGSQRGRSDALLTDVHPSKGRRWQDRKRPRLSVIARTAPAQYARGEP